MLDADTAAAVRDAITRVLDGREQVPPDLPMPPSIREHILAAAWPDLDPKRMELTTAGRTVGRAVTQVYLAGYFAGRACDAQVGAQVRAALGIPTVEAAKGTPHRYVGLAVCLVCDLAPSATIHEETRRD